MSVASAKTPTLEDLGPVETTQTSNNYNSNNSKQRQVGDCLEQLQAGDCLEDLQLQGAVYT